MKDNYLTVTAITKYLKRKIDTDPHLKNIWLKGEISNFNHHSRGHMYLTIKDDQTTIKSVMFAGNNSRLKFKPENGMNVLIKGEISIFEAFGQYQLYIQQMEPDGLGALYLAFEQLKEKLAKEGLFEEGRKREIPIYPKHIGIITSPTGAAVRDIITTIKRRYPIVDITVIPALVQGAQAAKSIVEAIEIANKIDFDVLIVGRGGGSIEDLWSFNEEIVAKAIYESIAPIIAAIGHETDFTISDYVADLRAPTPTSAAELAVPSQVELKEKVANITRSMIRTMDMKVNDQQKYLQRMNQSYAFRYPENLLKQKEQELDRYTERLERSLVTTLKQLQEKLAHVKTRFLHQHPQRQVTEALKDVKQLSSRKNTSMSLVLDDKTRELSTVIGKLTLLNPLDIMKRGFAIPYTDDGNIIVSSKQVKKEALISIKLSDGIVDCQVLDVKEEK